VPAFSSLPSDAVPFISAPTCRRFDEPKWRSCEGQEETRGANVVFLVRRARAHVRRVLVEAAISYGRKCIQVGCEGAQGVQWTIDVLGKQMLTPPMDSGVLRIKGTIEEKCKGKLQTSIESPQLTLIDIRRGVIVLTLNGGYTVVLRLQQELQLPTSYLVFTSS